jgi:hypothetical protein
MVVDDDAEVAKIISETAAGDLVNDMGWTEGAVSGLMEFGFMSQGTMR